MEELVRIFKSVSDPTRLRILRMLAIKPLCVCEVMSVLGMAQSTTSRHLGILAAAGLIEALPGGTWTVYRLPSAAKGAAGRVLALIGEAPVDSKFKMDAAAAGRADRNRLCCVRAEKTIKRQRRG